METKIITLNSENFNLSELQIAAELIKKGELVAFPTETVYGLGANALDGSAVQKIFQAKGRPSDNPLIVHICSVDQIYNFVENIPNKAKTLMEKYWPGPMTLILKKKPLIPNNVTAGLDTVAIRMPSHPIARALITLANLPIAAPSANRSGKTSPTKAIHVYEDLNGIIPLIIDGGQCSGGLESTVIDLQKDPPLILRPGILTLETLQKEIPNIRYYSSEIDKGDLEQRPSTPGMKYKHYSPETPLILFTGNPSESIEKMNQYIQSTRYEQIKVLLTNSDSKINETQAFQKKLEVQCLTNDQSKKDVARNLFAALRESDHQKFDILLIQGVPETEEGKAIMNRLKKAAHQIF